MTELVLPAHSSFSQLSTFTKCPQQWYLERGLGIKGRPNWATVGGSAVHSATETWDYWTLQGQWPDDLDTCRELFMQAFQKAIENEAKYAPEEFQDPSTWRASGRASKEWPDKETRRWWEVNGPLMVRRWMMWRTNNPSWELASLPNGEQGSEGIEIPCETTLGGVKVKMFIDRLFHRDHVDLLVVDLKSGSYTPDDGTQLGTYGVGLEDSWGVTPSHGAYWMARTGSLTPPEDLQFWPRERLDYLYKTARGQQERGEFLPKRSPMCGSCSVRASCYAVGGELSDTVPLPWEVSVVNSPAPPLD